MQPIPSLNPLMSPSAAVRALRRGLTGDTSVVAGTVFLQNALRIVSSVILTRLLNVEAFGVIGIITSVSVTFALLSDIGIIAFVVRHHRGQDPRFIDEVWTLRLIRSVALSVGVAVLSGPIAAYLGKPELQLAIAVGGLTFLLDGLDSMAMLTALRSRRLKRLSVVDVASQLFGLATSITLAALLGSYWAIISSNLLAQLFRAWLSYAMFPGSQRRWRFERERISEMWKFSRFITASTILTLVISQADKLVLSRAFPLDLFALYVIGAALAAAPVGMASAYAGRVLYPRYAEIVRTEPESMRRRFYSERMTPSLLYAVAVGGFIALAPMVVELLYDPRYLGAGTYLRILLISSFFSLGNSAVNDVMLAIGKASFTLSANIVRVVYLGLFGWFAWLNYGPLGLIWIVGTIEIIVQLFSWAVIWRRGLLDISKEMLLLLAGLFGLGIGWTVDVSARAFFLMVG